MSWVDDALCAEIGGDWWMPEPGVSAALTRRAKKICAECPVRQECLDYAIETRQVHGIYGGLSPRERQTLRRAG